MNGFMNRIYQICPVFRNAEGGTRHSCEFTMCEWYRTDADYTAMMDDCESLIKSLGFTHFGACALQSDWQRLSVADAFTQYADIDLEPLLNDTDAFKAATDVRTSETDTWEDIFHAVMAEKIEPYLGQGAPTILYDYPICMAALAQKANDPRFAERFELYISGVELANAFSELTDASEQRTRLEADMAHKKALYGIDAQIDEQFLRALEYGMPTSSGCALGLDRLVMLACDTDNIENVLWTAKP